MKGPIGSYHHSHGIKESISDTSGERLASVESIVCDAVGWKQVELYLKF